MQRNRLTTCTLLIVLLIFGSSIDLPSLTTQIDYSIFTKKNPAQTVAHVLVSVDNSGAVKPDVRKPVAEKVKTTPVPKVSKKVKSKYPDANTDYHFYGVERRIMTAGTKNVEELSDFLLVNNPRLSSAVALQMASYYIDECRLEGVNHDIAFCQMCLETGFLSFGGVVSPRQNNFCGLGAINEHKRGEFFDSRMMGVRAHIQHLKAYGSQDPLNGELIDNRFKWVKRGCSPTVDGLAGRWAADTEYAVKIKYLLKRLGDRSPEVSNLRYASN